MRKPYFHYIYILLSIGMTIGSASEPLSVKSEQPSYPVFGILEVDPSFKSTTTMPIGNDALAEVCHRKFIYANECPELRAIRDARLTTGNYPQVLVYMGGFTTNMGGAPEIEKGYRQAVAMIDVTTLASGLDISATEVRVRIPKDGEFPIKASTTDVTDERNHDKYCFWIRVDDELMKVIKADAKNGVLQVQRGFESKAAPHADGATVFTPVYLGNRDDLEAIRHTNSWPDGPDALRYALDPASDAAQRYKANLIAELIKSGYDGPWLDTFQPLTYNLCDAVGRKVTCFWDFTNQRRYGFESYLATLQQFVRGIRQKAKQITGRDPVIAANNVSAFYAQGGKQLFAAPDRPDLLNGGYCFEDSYITPRGSSRAEGKDKLTASFNPLSAERWLRSLKNQSDAARSGLKALCMMGPAGRVAAYISPALNNYGQLLRFSWCSFLLTVTKERTSQFGLPLLITEREGKAVFLPLPGMFFVSIGDPLDGNEIDALMLPNSSCYLRKFAGGLVVVNAPGNGAPAAVEIPAGYGDWESKQPVTRLTLPPGDGRLLVKF